LFEKEIYSCHKHKSMQLKDYSFVFLY
jgi:hypothetical protein